MLARQRLSFPAMHEQHILFDGAGERKIGRVGGRGARFVIVSGAEDEPGGLLWHDELGDGLEAHAAPVVVVAAPGRDAMEVADVLGLWKRQEFSPRQRDGILDQAADLESPGVERDVRLLAEVEHRPVLDSVLTHRQLRHSVPIRRARSFYTRVLKPDIDRRGTELDLTLNVSTPAFDQMRSVGHIPLDYGSVRRGCHKVLRAPLASRWRPGLCKYEATVDDRESHRPPVDDLSFLDDLDRGLDLVPQHGGPRVESSAIAAAADEALAVAAPLFPAGVSKSRPRPLLELFPPSAAIGASAGVPAAPSAASPIRVPDAASRPAPPSASRAPGGYETFYGLREKPFAPEPDTKFFYHSVEHDRASQELYSSIFRRDGLAVLTGDAGTGKTLMCRALLDRIDRRTFTSFVDDPWVTLEDLLKAILFDFGVISRTDLAGPRLAEATRHELTAALHEFLLSLAQINGFAVVFIDDAQTLSAEMLAQIQDVADTDQALMGIVLIGQPELLLKLGRRPSASGAARELVRARLDPLADDEIAAYVLHRLAISGAGRLSIEFEDAALALIFEISQGVPQIVNLVCDRALTRGFEASVTIIGEPLVSSAARDLDLIVSEPAGKRTMRKVGAAAALVGLMLLGAAAGAFVFRAQLGRAIAAWASPPASPPDPILRPPPPIEPRPPNADDSPTSRGRQ